VILLSQSTVTIITRSTQFNSSNLVRALDFTYLPDQHTKNEPYLIDFCDPVDVESECLKYLSDARDIPLGQERQLTFLINNLKLKDIQMVFIKLMPLSEMQLLLYLFQCPKKSRVSEKLLMLDSQSQIYDDQYR
jgi:hypothetical protein